MERCLPLACRLSVRKPGPLETTTYGGEENGWLKQGQYLVGGAWKSPSGDVQYGGMILEKGG